MEKKIIPFDSDEAAKPGTVSGWISGNGFFHASEEQARYDGCTHRPCQKCGTLTEKCWTECESCRAAERKKKDAEALAKMKREEWNGTYPLYLDGSDEYFFDADDIDEVCDAHGKTFDEMQFQLCKPNHPRMIEEDDFHDDLTEDGDIPDELMAAIDEFNIVAKDIVLSWSPTNVIAVEGKGKANEP